jgi:hypothetical protein
MARSDGKEFWKGQVHDDDHRAINFPDLEQVLTSTTEFYLDADTTTAHTPKQSLSSLWARRNSLEPKSFFDSLTDSNAIDADEDLFGLGSFNQVFMKEDEMVSLRYEQNDFFVTQA